MRRMTCALALVALAGCATGYKPAGGFGAFGGGFDESQLGPNVWRVTFKGNNYTSAERAEEMTLLRSADVVLQGGFDHFIIVDSRSRTDSTVVTQAPNRSQTQGTVSHAYGNTYNYTANTQYQGGGSWVMNKPSSSNTIVAFKGRPTDVQGQVYDARFLYDSLGRKHGVVK